MTSTNDTSPQQSTIRDDHFPFMKLPLELRNMIYTEYLLDIGMSYNLNCSSHLAHKVVKHLPPLSKASKQIHVEVMLVSELIWKTRPPLFHLTIMNVGRIVPQILKTAVPLQKITNCSITLECALVNWLICWVGIRNLLHSLTALQHVTFDIRGAPYNWFWLDLKDIEKTLIKNANDRNLRRWQGAEKDTLTALKKVDMTYDLRHRYGRKSRVRMVMKSGIGSRERRDGCISDHQVISCLSSALPPS
jgi:hypothetical protein